ncbi:prenyltransferase/squalene oxidase repeat-containing protein [Saccharomonospora sp. NPDC046836]|uniref:prenyltransferase/squalene oxidase repeat-containing protein n=1 Tax=Saccharomonospora sp. NPDC046836 TaxID=3156921 RepID=UPI0033F6964B
MGSQDALLGKATALVSEMAADPWGQFSPSVYETGRLVSFTPSLSGHTERVTFLLRQQQPDGRWGGPGNYDIVPTLSATEALMRESRRPGGDPGAAVAAERGLQALAKRLRPNGSLPDTVAVEIMVPGLVADLNAHLERHGRSPLPTPAGCYDDLLAHLRTAVAQGHALPEKLLHSLEVIGEPARAASFVRPVHGGIVGCSPAATAAWLGDEGVRDEQQPSVRYLLAVQGSGGGIPVAAPLALFERAWVLSTLASAGIDVRVPRELVNSLHAAFGADGAAGGHGLPPDADDTGTALHALALLGSPRSPECLRDYFTGDHFSCFPEERTPSTSTNAHVLQAIGASLAPDLPDRTRYAGIIAGWLAGQQEPDGSWRDKWHASPYYATACCATALAEYGGEHGARAVHRAVDWLLATQRADGSWGHWQSTVEETAYAVRTLLRATVSAPSEAADLAAARGSAYLAAADGAEHPPLWHDKDLYTPLRIVETEVLVARYLADTNPRLASLVADQVARVDAR